MAYWHGDIGKRKTGGEVTSHRGKRKHELGSVQADTRIGKDKRVVVRRKNANVKIRALTVEFANVTDPKTRETKKVKIKGIASNRANIHYVRRLIVTKGTVIETEIGNAIVTSRPSQDGVVNAVKVE